MVIREYGNNQDDIKSQKQSLIMSTSEETVSSLNKPLQIFMNDSPLRSEKNFTLAFEKEIKCDSSLSWDQSNGCEVAKTVEINNTKKSQQFGIFCIKDEEHSPRLKSFSHFDVFSTDSTQTSSSVSQSAIKYDAVLSVKIEKEVPIPASKQNSRTEVKSEPECDSSLSRNESKFCEVAKVIDNRSIRVFQHCKRTLKSENEEYDIPSSSNTESSLPSPFKAKLQYTKRRAGTLYKQLTSSKLSKVTSKYFSQANNSETRWIPPRSPYALVQEDLFDNPWQLLVATVFLTKTTAKRALPQLHKFLARFPRPEDVLKANYEDIDHYFKPLGLTTTRSHVIMRFTVEFLEKDWTYPRELYGIGKYGDDSYRIFCINEWRQVTPDDIPLTMYCNWLSENAKRLGLD